MNTSLGLEALVQHFRQRGWHFAVREADRIVDCTVTARNANFRCLAVVDESDEVFQFFCQIPLIVPPEKRSAAAELCCRISYKLKVGHFELDVKDGELRYHAGVPYPKGQLADEVIHRTIAMSLITADVHLKAFMALICTNCSPEAAEQSAEQSLKDLKADVQAHALAASSRMAFN